MLLLDEPLGALDLKLRKQMQLELKAIQHEFGITFVHVTHDQEEAMTMADTIAVMQGGRIEQLGDAERAVRACRNGVCRRLPRRVQSARTAPSPATAPSGSTAAARSRRPRGARRQDRARGRRHSPGKIRVGRSESERVLGTRQGDRVRRSLDAVSGRDACGDLTVYVAERGIRSGFGCAGGIVELSFSPEAAFVVDATSPEEEE